MWIKLNLPTISIYIICIYRSPARIFTLFTQSLDTILNQLYKPNIEIII